MRSKLLIPAIFLLAALGQAKELKAYQDGKLLQMDSVTCDADSKNAAKKTQGPLCQEYTLETEQVDYRIRPVDEKHPLLLPIGADAQFRLDKVTLLLRVPTLDSKERKFVVVSVKPRGEKSADASPAKLNHLQ